MSVREECCRLIGNVSFLPHYIGNERAFPKDTLGYLREIGLLGIVNGNCERSILR